MIDTNGDNVFDSGGPKGTAMMKQAVAGCLNAMHDSTLMFAPHQNSYERLVPGKHAPTAMSWGYENRTSAIRIPAGNPAARRIEHRVAGGDVNPYLMLAAILGAALDGIEHEMEPASPIVGNAYAVDGLPQIADSWEAAIDAHGAIHDRAALSASRTDQEPRLDQASGTALSWRIVRRRKRSNCTSTRSDRGAP